MIRHVSWKSGRGSLYPQVRVQPLSYVPPQAVCSTAGYTGGRKLTEGGLGAMGMTLNLRIFPGVVTHVDVGLW